MRTMILGLIVLFLGTVPVMAEPPGWLERGGNTADLVLHCEPLYAVEDQRDPPSQLREVHYPTPVYYLFSNADLALFQIQLYNNSPEEIAVENQLGSTWPERLRVEVHSEDGAPIPVAMEVLESQREQVRLRKDGKVLHRFDLDRSPSGAGSRITTPHDEREKITTDFAGADRLLIAPKEVFEVKVRLVSYGGEVFPAGPHRVNFHDPLFFEQCDLPLVLVVGQPATQEDLVDDHLVRYRLHKDQGVHEAAHREMVRATEQAPSSLRAWLHRASAAAFAGDLEDQYESSLVLERLLDREALEAPVSATLRAARDFVLRLPELERKLQKVPETPSRSPN